MSSYEESLCDSGNIRRGELLGSGTFGQVYRSEHSGFGPVAERVIPSLDATTEEDIREGLRPLYQLRCDNATRLYGLVLQPEGYSLLTEYAQFGPVEELMKVKPPWPVRAKVMREVAMGLKYLHAHHVIHGNLTRHNVVISADLVAKVTDYGLREWRMLASTASNSSLNTGQYTPPETFTKPVTEAVAGAFDVYSYGILSWEVITCEHAWKGLCPAEIHGAVRRGRRPALRGGEPFPAPCPASMRNVTAEAWRQQPGDRPDFSEILRMMKKKDVLWSADELRTAENEAKKKLTDALRVGTRARHGSASAAQLPRGTPGSSPRTATISSPKGSTGSSLSGGARLVPRGTASSSQREPTGLSSREAVGRAHEKGACSVPRAAVERTRARKGEGELQSSQRVATLQDNTATGHPRKKKVNKTSTPSGSPVGGPEKIKSSKSAGGGPEMTRSSRPHVSGSRNLHKNKGASRLPTPVICEREPVAKTEESTASRTHASNGRDTGTRDEGFSESSFTDDQISYDGSQCESGAVGSEAADSRHLHSEPSVPVVLDEVHIGFTECEDIPKIDRAVAANVNLAASVEEPCSPSGHDESAPCPQTDQDQQRDESRTPSDHDNLWNHDDNESQDVQAVHNDQYEAEEESAEPVTIQYRGQLRSAPFPDALPDPVSDAQHDPVSDAQSDLGRYVQSVPDTQPDPSSGNQADPGQDVQLDLIPDIQSVPDRDVQSYPSADVPPNPVPDVQPNPVSNVPPSPGSGDQLDPIPGVMLDPVPVPQDVPPYSDVWDDPVPDQLDPVPDPSQSATPGAPPEIGRVNCDDMAAPSPFHCSDETSVKLPLEEGMQGIDNDPISEQLEENTQPGSDDQSQDDKEAQNDGSVVVGQNSMMQDQSQTSSHVATMQHQSQFSSHAVAHPQANEAGPISEVSRQVTALQQQEENTAAAGELVTAMAPSRTVPLVPDLSYPRAAVIYYDEADPDIGQVKQVAHLLKHTWGLNIFDPHHDGVGDKLESFHQSFDDSQHAIAFLTPAVIRDMQASRLNVASFRMATFLTGLLETHAQTCQRRLIPVQIGHDEIPFILCNFCVLNPDSSGFHRKLYRAVSSQAGSGGLTTRDVKRWADQMPWSEDAVNRAADMLGLPPEVLWDIKLEFGGSRARLFELLDCWRLHHGAGATEARLRQVVAAITGGQGQETIMGGQGQGQTAFTGEQRSDVRGHVQTAETEGQDHRQEDVTDRQEQAAATGQVHAQQPCMREPHQQGAGQNASGRQSHVRVQAVDMLGLLRVNRVQLIDALRYPEPVLDHLYSRAVITQYEMQVIRAHRVKYDQAGELLDIIATKGDWGCREFKSVLQKESPHAAAFLET